MKEETKRQSYEERVLRVLIYIQEHLDSKLSLEQLAEIAEFSPYHFHRIFRSIVTENVTEYVRRLRLERAARALKNSTQSITTLAFDAGYETHESFSRAFRTMFGESPSQFRKKYTNTETPVAFHFQRTFPIKKLQEISEGVAPNISVEIHEIESLSLAFFRHTGMYTKESIEKANDVIVEYFKKKKMPQEEMQVIGILYDDPEITPADKLRYDACVIVDSLFEPNGTIGLQYIAGGDYAVMSHNGSIDTVEQTILRFYGDWLPFSKREVRSKPLFFRYIFEKNSISSINIYIPLEPRSF